MIQKARTAIVIFIIFAGLAACIPIVKIDEDARIRLRQHIKVYNSEELPGMKYNSLGAIDGISCMAKTTEPPASKEDAIDLLRYRSRAMGGNGVMGVTCQQPQGLTLSPDCWNSVTCNAIAIQVEPMGNAPTIAAPQVSMAAQSTEQAKKREANDLDTLRPLDVEQLQAGVVKITAKPSGAAQKAGTGFIVRLDKDAVYIITAAHVVSGDPQPQVEFFTKRNAPVPAEILPGAEGGDEIRGLALLMVKGKENIPAGLAQLSLASSNHPTAGQDIILIGFPRGVGPWAVIKGNITSRQGRDIYFSPTVGEGNSGGPIILNGKVVGLVGAGGQLIGQGVTARSIEDYFDGFGVTLSKTLEDRPIQSRTIHIQEKLGKGDELVSLVFYKSNMVDLKQVHLDSVKLAAKEFNAELEDKQRTLVELYTARMELVARRVAERDHWDVVLEFV